MIFPDHGRYGTRTLIAIPVITGGQGSLTSFKAQIPKRIWTYRGKEVSLLSATCPGGSLFAHGDFAFANGTQIEGDVAKSCVPG